MSTIITAAVFSCQSAGEESAQDVVFKEVQVDTLMVNSKGQIIDLKFGLNAYGFNEDKSRLYKFNTNNRHGIEVINLNTLELESFIPFEKEGPNGTSSWVSSVAPLPNNQFTITNNSGYYIFNNKAQLLKTHNLLNMEFVGDSIPADLRMENAGEFDAKVNLSFNLLVEGYGYLRGIAKTNLSNRERELFLIDDLKILDKYHLKLTMGNRMIMLRTNNYAAIHEDKFILSNDMQNELYYFDLKTDTIVHRKYHSQFTPDQNEVFGKQNLETREEIGEIMEQRQASGLYKMLVFDQKSQLYYRFSVKSQPSTAGVTQEALLEKKWNVYLTIFDQDLNQVAETDQLPIKFNPEKYFFKDGKLFIYQNMDDELAFIVLSFN